MVLLDFSKAFDSVYYPLLLLKLKHYFGFSSSAVALIDSYLKDRYQRVCSKGSTSTSELITSGVPQGSILGPILFSIFVNDIVSACNSSLIHLYADDAQIYLSRPIGLYEDLICRLNEDLESICMWSRNNFLNLNVGKTKAIAIAHNTNYIKDLPPLILGNSLIKLDQSVTSLGFILNDKLTCTNHIDFTIRKMNFGLRKLYQSAKLLPPETKMKLVRSLILPFLSYGEIVYGTMDEASLTKLKRIINNMARFVFAKRRYDRISAFANQILNCSLRTYLEKRNLIFLHKLINSKCPHYLFSKLEFAQSARTRNFILPESRFSATLKMFFVSTVKLWNSLPNNIKSETNMGRFRLALESHFLARDREL